VAAPTIKTAAAAPPELCTLPRGRHGLPRDFVEENQRTRTIAGTIEAVAKRGYAATTVGDCVEAARVSRKTFYHLFAGKEECFTAAYEAGIGEIRRRFVAEFDANRGWEEAIEAALASVLGFLAENPHVARATMVEVLSSTPELAARHHATIAGLAPYLTRDREAALTEEVIVAGIFALISQRILAGHTETLPHLLPELVGLVRAPYRQTPTLNG